MRGHVARKGNRYYAVVYEGFDAATGQERHRWHAAGDTRKDAEKLLGELVKRMHDGDYRAPERITFGDYLLERWLPTKQSQLRPSTFSSYRNNVITHIAPRIGSIPLQKLQPEDLDTFYAQLLREGRRNGAGGGLAPKTVRIIHGIIRKALADAMRKGTVTRNVADLADPPKVRLGGSREMTVWSRTLPTVARRIARCSSVVRVVGLRLAIADRRVEVGEEVKGSDAAETAGVRQTGPPKTLGASL